MTAEAGGMPAPAAVGVTLRVPIPEAGPPGLLALYVTGSRGGLRHILPLCGRATLGRSRDCTIVLDDARVSRVHAALEIGDGLILRDLASVNGTLLRSVPLRAREPYPLACGETFFIGDQALSVHTTRLRPAPPDRFVALDQLVECARRGVCQHAGSSPGPGARPGVILLRILPRSDKEWDWLSAVAGDLALSLDAWFAPVGPGGLALAVPAWTEEAVASVERDARASLALHRIAATADAIFLRADAGGLAQAVSGFALAQGALRLKRGPVVFRDPAMQAVRLTVTRAAPFPAPVLILGETGVGKDVVASMLHELSPRSSNLFLSLNCAALPEALIESELFGYTRGSFTGADRSKPGLIEAAAGGTVFLDEIGEMPLSAQAKLLRAIETSEVTRLGEIHPRRLDVRFVAASNRNLAAEAKAGRFRSDLLYRLSVVVIEIPPLRARRSEIAPLASLFLDQACARFGRSLSLSPAALSVLEVWPWPGNIRELHNVVERAALLAGEEVVEPHHLSICAEATWSESPAPTPASSAEEKQEKQERQEREEPGLALAGAPSSERARVEAALRECGGNQRRAAERLGMPLRTLVRRIAQLGLPRPRTG